MKDYAIFMAMIEKIGHDKRGNTIFKRDKYGNEILVPETNFVVRETRGEYSAVKTTSKTKVIDDQTTQVPVRFTEWKKKEGIVW